MDDLYRVSGQEDLCALAVKGFDFGYPNPERVFVDRQAEGADGASEKVPDIPVGMFEERLMRSYSIGSDRLQ